jgi:branched-subunit amino acid ABC-type transport system permease component
METLLQAIGFGFVTASIVSLSAVSISIQYSVSGVPNFAHGELLTIAAYIGVSMQTIVDGFWLPALAGLLVAAGLAIAMQAGVLQPFIRRNVSQTVLLVVSVSLGLLIQNLIVLTWGPTNQKLQVSQGATHDVGPFLFTTSSLVIIAVGAVALVSLHLLLQYTRFGKALRAVADNRSLAGVTGIDPGRVTALSFAIAGVLAGIAGVSLASAGGGFGPTLGFQFLLVTFAAAIIGGIGKVYGAMLGGLIIGIVTEVGGAYVNASYKQVFALTILAAVLLFRPQGLFTTLRGQAAHA